MRASLEYPGQVAYPIADDDPQLAELLAPVRARGARYVPTPQAATR